MRGRAGTEGSRRATAGYHAGCAPCRAALVFAEVGLDAASVEAICERTGFTRGAFYSNFETKDALMLALIERVAGEKIDEVAERVAVLQARGEDLEPGALVCQLQDVAFEKKQGILLTSEIRTRAMRDPRLAET
nr:helix-turn-helix domain-containing protein [Pyxidicoccus fallax]